MGKMTLKDLDVKGKRAAASVRLQQVIIGSPGENSNLHAQLSQAALLHEAFLCLAQVSYSNSELGRYLSLRRGAENETHFQTMWRSIA